MRKKAQQANCAQRPSLPAGPAAHLHCSCPGTSLKVGMRSQSRGEKIMPTVFVLSKGH